MGTIKVGKLQVRGDLKATKKELEKMFSFVLSDKEIDELDSLINAGNNRTNGKTKKKVSGRKRKGSDI